MNEKLIFMDMIEIVFPKETTNIDKLTADINTFENDLSELIQLKIRNLIDDTFYNKEYQRIRADLDKQSRCRSLKMNCLRL